MAHGTLQVLFEGQVLQSIALEGPVLSIGRFRENDVVIDNPAVSRHHARIVLEGGRLFLEDQGSDNGCVVNGRRVDRAPIAPGDDVQIGGHQLVLFAPEAPALSEPDATPASRVAESAPWDGADTDFLPQEDPAPTRTPAVEEHGHAGLIVQLRGQLERVVSVEKTPFVIGRAPECDLVLSESGVSRRHACIVQEADEFVLEDLGGMNGTFVAGERVERRPLEVGDEIALDVYQITFVLERRPLAEEIRLGSAADSDEPAAAPHAASFAETLPPGEAIALEGDASATPGRQGPGSEEAPVRCVPVSASAARSGEVAVAAQEGGCEPAPEAQRRGAGATQRLALELEIEADALPEALRAALLDAGEAGLGVPVTLRVRAALRSDR